MDYIVDIGDNSLLIENAARYSSSIIVDELKATRLQNKLTQQDIADATGIDRANIARLESKKHIPSIEVLSKYAESMGYHLDIHLIKN